MHKTVAVPDGGQRDNVAALYLDLVRRLDIPPETMAGRRHEAGQAADAGDAAS